MPLALRRCIALLVTACLMAPEAGAYAHPLSYSHSPSIFTAQALNSPAHFFAHLRRVLSGNKSVKQTPGSLLKQSVPAETPGSDSRFDWIVLGSVVGSFAVFGGVVVAGIHAGWDVKMTVTPKLKPSERRVFG